MLTAPSVPDPLEGLAPGGRRLVAQAKRILLTKGWSALSVGAVTAAAALDRSAVRYYFGNKAGLVAVVVESVIHDENADELARLTQLGGEGDRIGVHLARHEASAMSRNAILFFELVPPLVRDPNLRRRLADWYAWYRRADAWAVAPERDPGCEGTVSALAALMQAVTDGLTLQYLADPQVAVSDAYAVWSRLVRAALADNVCVAGSVETITSRRTGCAATDAPALPTGAPSIADPRDGMPPSGRRMLTKARQLLVAKGWRGLSVDAVTSAAGLDKSAIRYYFGNKAGLVSAVVESVMHDENARELRHLAGLEASEDPLQIHMAHCLETSTNRRSVLTYFELVPHLLRDKGLRTKLADWYAWYRSVDAWVLSLETHSSPDRFGALAALMNAVGDGLALQRLADSGFDIRSPLELWQDMLQRSLAP